jgi:hypothetical protein
MNLVPIVAIVMVFGTSCWGVYWRHQRRRWEYDERRMMIERGMTLPPPRPDQGRTLDDSLRRGTITFCVGLGMLIAYAVLRSPLGQTIEGRLLALLAIGGPIVVLWGVGEIVYYMIAKRGSAPSATGSN